MAYLGGGGVLLRRIICTRDIGKGWVSSVVVFLRYPTPYLRNEIKITKRLRKSLKKIKENSEWLDGLAGFELSIFHLPVLKASQPLVGHHGLNWRKVNFLWLSCRHHTHYINIHYGIYILKFKISLYTSVYWG